MSLPSGFLDTLKANNDIVSVMSSYVELKRAGRDYVCLCPFHAERTPSCHVYTGSQSFYCFGCGAGGDVINFVRMIEHYNDFIESVKFLAQRAGMAMPDEGYDGAAEKRTRLLAMNRDAARYFRDVLLSPEGREGLEYLERRRVTESTRIKYGLGFAPDGWHNLQYHLRKLGYSDEEMEEGALLVRSRGSVYDKFRKRVMFPIIDVRGNVIAFGGRTLEPDAPAKYLNSDETSVFRKRENLFSLNFAKNTKESFLILCEGYMDVISLNQAGFDSAVATLGTAITPQQAKVMKRYANEVIISYDADAAGQKATMKAINLLDEAGIKARVLNIPDAKDPDEYIKNFGADRFRVLLAGTSTALDHEFRLLQNGLALDTAPGRAEFIKRAVPFLAKIQSDTDRAVYITETARISGQQENTVTDLVNDRRDYDSENRERAEERELIRSTVQRDPINPDAMNFPREEKAERGVIAFLMHSPDYMAHVDKRLTAEDFPTEFNRRVFTFISEGIHLGENVDLSYIGSGFSAEETARVTQICSLGNKLPYSLQRLDEYIKVLTEHSERASEKPVTQLSDDEMLQRIEELREKRRKH
ncbi:MAG: DNA primase [Ruminiclostridium sp.]|nr:DNA primase [Ruminiclostridium sp.]